MAPCRDLLQWCFELDGQSRHRLLLVVSSRIEQCDLDATHEIGKKAFSNVISIKQRTPDERPWPRAANAMFRTAWEWIRQSHHEPWLWLEPDCCPMVPKWLDTLEEEYKRAGKPFMGTIYTIPVRHLNGVMVYPANLPYYNRPMLGAQEVSFDLIQPQVNLRHGHNTHLMQRLLADPNLNQACSFPDIESLKQIRQGVVLFHGCKDSTAIRRLREQREPKKFSRIRLGKLQLFKKQEKITIRRTGAIGDAIAATCVANHLHALGYVVDFQTHETCREILRYCPTLKVLTGNSGQHKPDVDLDGAYENDPQRQTKHFSEMFIARANSQLASRGIILQPLNTAPHLRVSQSECKRFMFKHRKWPRPWVGIYARSASFLTRTVHDHIWKQAAAQIKATCFWMSNHSIAPDGLVDLGCKEIKHVMLAIGTMDLVVGPDSGPGHIALAMGIPSLFIGQSSDPVLHFSDQRDWQATYP